MADPPGFPVTVTTLSPLHIGSGERLREGFDFIEHQGYLWVANQGALLRTILDEAAHGLKDLAEAAGRLAGMTLYQWQQAGWLRDEHFQTPGLFRYRLAGRTATQEKRGELLEQIKDVYGRPYLPGSSLKGALRTILAWAHVQEPVRLGQLGERRKYAARPLEEDLFAPGAPLDKRGRKVKTANYDLLRALQVSDSRPVNPDRLGLATVELVSESLAAQEGPPIHVEALTVGTVFDAEIGIDEALFTRRAARLRLQDREKWLKGLAQAGRDHAGQRIADEIAYYQVLGGAPETLRFYQDLAAELGSLAPDEFLLQLGWGAGWDSKTLGSRLRADPAGFAHIVKQYGLAEGPRRGQQKARWSPDDPFPGTRKEAALSGDSPLPAGQPLGWVRVHLAGFDEWARAARPAEPAAVPRPPSPGPAAPRPAEPPAEPAAASRPENLRAGMELAGVVSRIAPFGAFVDIGVRRDGLVHISKLTDSYVRDVRDVVQEGQRVRVRVLAVEQRDDDWRISLSMKGVRQELS